MVDIWIQSRTRGSVLLRYIKAYQPASIKFPYWTFWQETDDKDYCYFYHMDDVIRLEVMEEKVGEKSSDNTINSDAHTAQPTLKLIDS